MQGIIAEEWHMPAQDLTTHSGCGGRGKGGRRETGREGSISDNPGNKHWRFGLEWEEEVGFWKYSERRANKRNQRKSQKAEGRMPWGKMKQGCQ